MTKYCFPLIDLFYYRIPKQQYHISVTTKKVYDLTERKNFCSFVCMRASNYIRIQLLTSPLWMRDQEIIPEFKILTIKENK